MTSYTARVELDTRAADLQRIARGLDGFHPVTAHTPHGRAEVTISLPAEGLRQAITAALAIVEDATGHDVIAVEAMLSDEHQRRQWLAPVPELLSITEAADELGITGAAIRQRLMAQRPSIAGVKIGSTWAIPRTEVLRLKAAAVPTSDPITHRTEEKQA